MKSKVNLSGTSRFRITLLAAAITALSTPVFSQSGGNVLEEVIVTGFRNSLREARDLKRDAVGSQDSIIAEDIAAFPDLNLAESLQRIPGVTITREGGEGRQISLRGLGPDFTRVLVNGMEALGTSASTLDARGAVTRTRGFDFNIFASELFNRVDVYKSFSADQEEGGMAGTVNLGTAKPFDYDGYKAVVSGQLGSNTNSDSKDPRIVGLVSNTWGNFGALVSVAYSERESEEFGTNTTRWRKRANDTAGAGLPDAQRIQVENGDIWFPRGVRDSGWLTDQERLGITTSFQFKPTDNFSLSLDALFGRLSSDKREFHLVNSFSLPRGHDILSLTTETVQGDAAATDPGGDIQLVSGTFAVNDQSVVTESRSDQSDSDFDNIVLSGDWQVNDRLIVDFLIGRSTATFEKPVSDNAFTQNQAGVPIEFTVDCSSFECTRSFADGFNPQSTEDLQYRELRFREDFISNDFDNIQLDFAYELSEELTLKFGLNQKSYENTNERYELRSTDADFAQVSDFVFADPALDANPDSLYTTFTRSDGASWIVSDLNARQEAAGVSNLDLKSLGSDFGRSRPLSRVEEDTLAFYAQLGFDYGALRGNVGLRHYDTDAEGNGRNEFGEDTIFSFDYSGVLPALNLSYNLTDEFVLRFSAAKNVNRQPLTALNPTPSVRTDPNFLDIRGGSPDLEHMESTDFEIGAEYYFSDDSGYIAFAYFDKDIDNFITEFSQAVRYGDTGLSLGLLEGGVDENGAPLTADTFFQESGLINIPSAGFSGIELSGEKDFNFLPGAWKNFGIRASITLADGDTDYRNLQVAPGETNSVNKSFVGLSETSYNTTLYYETDVWGVRLSQTYRDDWLSRVEVGLGDEDERGFHATNFVDFAAFYQVNDALKLTFKANNLTNEKEELYSDSSDRSYSVTESGSNFYLGATWGF